MPQPDETGVTPFEIGLPQARIDDLHERLRRTRLPEAPTDPGQGIAPALVAEYCREWLEVYDWRSLEAELNGLGQFRTRIDGLGLHFLHVRSTRPDARPLIITHGWPSSVVEALDVIPGLADPPAGEPAFHVVVPSLPGYGFSDKPTEPGWGLERIADAWAELMGRLGYERFFAQGGDWGAMITTTLALRHPGRVAMMHTTVPWAPRPEGFEDKDFTELEARWQAEEAVFRARSGGRAMLDSKRPQLLGYGLTDSPAGQLAWIIDPMLSATGRDAHGQCLIPRRRLLDNVSIYWFTASAASSARLYWESLGKIDMKTPVTVASAVTVFPNDLMKLPRAWVEKRYTDLRRWNLADRGGHLAMAEVPDLFVSELRAAFALAPDQAPAASGVGKRGKVRNNAELASNSVALTKRAGA
jgi:epoxide hydrolase